MRKRKSPEVPTQVKQMAVSASAGRKIISDFCFFTFPPLLVFAPGRSPLFSLFHLQIHPPRTALYDWRLSRLLLLALTPWEKYSNILVVISFNSAFRIWQDWLTQLLSMMLVQPSLFDLADFLPKSSELAQFQAQFPHNRIRLVCTPVKQWNFASVRILTSLLPQTMLFP